MTYTIEERWEVASWAVRIALPIWYAASAEDSPSCCDLQRVTLDNWETVGTEMYGGLQKELEKRKHYPRAFLPEPEQIQLVSAIMESSAWFNIDVAAQMRSTFDLALEIWSSSLALAIQLSEENLLKIPFDKELERIENNIRVAVLIGVIRQMPGKEITNDS